MCTFALAWQVFEDAPVVAAANRDESVDRPSAPPGRYDDEPRVVAPRDLEAGGTWIGVNEHGLLVAITNRWTAKDLAGDRSRGLLVADALGCESASEAVELVDRSRLEYEYSGFYLVIADSDDAVLASWDGTFEADWLDHGVHVITNVGHVADPSVQSHREEDAKRQAEQGQRVQDALESVASERRGTSSAPSTDDPAQDWLDRAESILGDHGYGVCRHESGFGTRSSSLIVLGDRPRYRYADGPPCRTPFESVDLESHI